MGIKYIYVLTAILSLVTLATAQEVFTNSIQTVYTNYYQTQLCKMLNPALNLCSSLNCPRAWVNGCPTCNCRIDLCQQLMCSANQQQCVIRLKQGQYVGQITHYAECIGNSGLPVTTTTTTQATTTTSKPLGTCDIVGRCDANGYCAYHDAVCRSDGLCCRVATNNNNIANVSHCLETPKIGQCRALGTQYVFNKTTGRCNDMIFGGCVASLNSFATLEQCQSTCELPCKKPTTAGRCRASFPRYYFDEATEKCEAFDYGGCAGDSNYFLTPWDCETHCKGVIKAAKASLTTTTTTTTTTTPTTTTTTTRRTPPIIIFPQNNNGIPTPTTTLGYEQQRQILTDRILNNFRNYPRTQNRELPSFAGEEKNQIYFRPRPQIGGTITGTDANGRIIYVNSNNQLVAQQLRTSAPLTQTPSATATTTTTQSNNNGGMYIRRLANRYRSANALATNQAGGMINYVNLVTRTSPPVASNRGLNPQQVPQYDSYMASVNGLRGYLQG